jgi:ribonucleoside-triphosphate reductase (thioredoxin)
MTPAKTSDTFRISPTFVAGYAARKPPFGFNGLGELVFLRTYSRLKEDGTQEQWHETVARVVNGTYTMQKRWILSHDLGWSEKKAQKSAQEMYDRIWNMKFLPPGRGLWAMGSPLTEEKGLYAALNNPLRATEEVYTREHGLIPIGQLDGQEATFYTPKGWVKGTVMSRGVQPVQRITFAPAMPNTLGEGWRKQRSNHRVNVVATPSHGWQLIDGTDTHDLKVGDVVQALRNADTEVTPEYRSGFVHGLIFGDGSAQPARIDGSKRFQIRLCGAKAQYIDRFESVTYPPSTEGDPLCAVSSSRDLKAFPSGAETSDYLRGFLDGWIAADGYSTLEHTAKLSAQHTDAASWLSKNAAIAGWVLIGQSTDSTMETNFGVRSSPCVRFTLTRRSDIAWKVIAIDSLDEPELVYCPTIPGVGSFALPSGIHSSNCAFVSTVNLDKDLADPFTFLMDASMLGIGVGFDTKGAGKLKLHLPDPDYDENGVEKNVYVIPDSREGWVDSLQVLLESYMVSGSKAVRFDYSQIRPAGEPIKGFGGVASGPEPLRMMHARIEAVLANRALSTAAPFMTVTDIVDIQNLIGMCVVAGNVRRTAEIAFGEATDEEFIDLKNYEKNPQRAEYGWTSNNSVFAEVGMDYGPTAERVALNGEPGYAWLENMRAYGRMGDAPNWADKRVAGANPCVEQSLESYELCCLVETFPANHESLEDYLRTLKFAYLYGKTVTLGKTPWARTNRVMLRNRRIGLSQSGIQQAIAKLGIEQYRQLCEEGYKTVRYYDNVYSEWLTIPKSVKVTSVKPSGSVSLLAGATPGMHWPENRVYIRRMRLSEFSDLVQPLKDAGYHVEQDVYSPNTLVVEIPVKIEENVRTAREVPLWEQLSMAAFLQKYWADNQVSATITFDPKTEGSQIAPALNYFQYQLKGISFLPRHDDGAYEQMPYEGISTERYDDLTSKISPINFGSTHESAEQEKFCSNDSCAI